MTRTEPLGERAVRLGLTTQEAIASALKEQRSRGEAGKKTLLGSLLVEMGLLVPTQLVRLLDNGPLSGFRLEEDAVRLAAQLPRLLPPGRRTILIAAARDGHGVSTLTSQLALALALMGEGSILVVDANLRWPVHHERFRIRQEPGLVEAVEGVRPLETCIAETGLRGLSVLPSGKSAGDALASLISDRCDELFGKLRERYAYVLIDAPGMLDHPEAALLASRTDGVIGVAMEGKAHRADVAECSRVLMGLGANLLGVVLSRKASRRESKVRVRA